MFIVYFNFNVIDDRCWSVASFSHENSDACNLAWWAKHLFLQNIFMLRSIIGQIWYHVDVSLFLFNVLRPQFNFFKNFIRKNIGFIHKFVQRKTHISDIGRNWRVLLIFIDDLLGELLPCKLKVFDQVKELRRILELSKLINVAIVNFNLICVILENFNLNSMAIWDAHKVLSAIIDLWVISLLSEYIELAKWYQIDQIDVLLELLQLIVIHNMCFQLVSWSAHVKTKREPNILAIRAEVLRLVPLLHVLNQLHPNLGAIHCLRLIKLDNKRKLNALRIIKVRCDTREHVMLHVKCLVKLSVKPNLISSITTEVLSMPPGKVLLLKV